MTMTTLDMTDGVYRRIYSGFLDNDKINAVSWQAEAWFWRLVVSADDFGNLRANWRHLAVNASPVRELTGEQAKTMTMELTKARLVSIYEVDGTNYIHIEGFTRRQPANRNGRRIQRFPMNPGESGCEFGNPGESGGIQDNPGECSPSDSDSDSDSKTDTDSNAETPQPPKGGAASPNESSPPAKRRKAKANPPTIDAVASVFAGRGFVGVAFTNALEAFYAHRQAIQNPLSLLSAAAMATKFEANGGEAAAVVAMTDSVANGWTGVFPEKVRLSGPASVAAANRGGAASIDSVIAEAQRLRELEERRTA